jgi:hypothetical protein
MQPGDNPQDNPQADPQADLQDNPEREERRPLSTEDLAAPRADIDAAQEGHDVDRAADRAEQGRATLEEQDRDRTAADTRFPAATGPDTDTAAARPPWRQPTGERKPAEADQAAAPLLPSGESDKFRVQWHEIQALFVDDPPEAVQSADQLVAEVMQAVATSFNDHKRGLERQWQRGEEVSTEELRQALRQYRSFFTRLLST